MLPHTSYKRIYHNRCLPQITRMEVGGRVKIDGGKGAGYVSAQKTPLVNTTTVQGSATYSTYRTTS